MLQGVAATVQTAKTVKSREASRKAYRAHQTHPAGRMYNLSIFKMRRFARLALRMGVTV